MSRPTFAFGARLLFVSAVSAALLLAAHAANAATGAPTQGDGLSGTVHLAYLDPGSGSFMVQALIAALAGLGVAGRRYWTQIKTWLGLDTRSAEDELDPDDD